VSRSGWSVLITNRSGSWSVLPSGPEPSRPSAGRARRSTWMPESSCAQALNIRGSWGEGKSSMWESTIGPSPAIMPWIRTAAASHPSASNSTPRSRSECRSASPRPTDPCTWRARIRPSARAAAISARSTRPCSVRSAGSRSSQAEESFTVGVGATPSSPRARTGSCFAFEDLQLLDVHSVKRRQGLALGLGADVLSGPDHGLADDVDRKLDQLEEGLRSGR